MPTFYVRRRIVEVTDFREVEANSAREAKEQCEEHIAQFVGGWSTHEESESWEIEDADGVKYDDVLFAPIKEGK